ADRIAVVSGIGPGLGREIALACAREGAHVVLAARTAAALEEVAEAVRARGRRAVAVATDLSRPDACQRLAGPARRQRGRGCAAGGGGGGGFGRVEVLVHNAFRSTPVALGEEADLDDGRRFLEVTLLGALRLTQAIVPAMKAQGSGAIVFVNSMSVRIVEPFMG